MTQKNTKADEWLVVCLCAAWCGTCKQYQQSFEALAAQFPQMRFVWLDVEDRDDVAGDLEIETFPSILVGQGSQAKFLGPVLPQTGVLARMLQSLPQDADALAKLLKTGHGHQACTKLCRSCSIQRAFCSAGTKLAS